MNLYKFNCVVFVQGESLAGAHDHLHGEVKYHFFLDNDLIALESGEGELVEETEDE